MAHTKGKMAEGKVGNNINYVQYIIYHHLNLNQIVLHVISLWVTFSVTFLHVLACGGVTSEI